MKDVEYKKKELRGTFQECMKKGKWLKVGEKIILRVVLKEID